MEKSGCSAGSSRSKRMLDLARRVHARTYEDENHENALDENAIPQSPCPAVNSIDFLNFCKTIDNKGTPSSHVTPTGKAITTSNYRQKQKPKREVLSTIPDNSIDFDLRSPPKKNSHTGNVYEGKANVQPNAVARRCLLDSYAPNSMKPNAPENVISGLGMLALYESDDSQSSTPFPEPFGQSVDGNNNGIYQCKSQKGDLETLPFCTPITSELRPESEKKLRDITLTSTRDEGINQSVDSNNNCGISYQSVSLKIDPVSPPPSSPTDDLEKQLLEIRSTFTGDEDGTTFAHLESVPFSAEPRYSPLIVENLSDTIDTVLNNFENTSDGTSTYAQLESVPFVRFSDNTDSTELNSFPLMVEAKSDTIDTVLNNVQNNSDGATYTELESAPLTRFLGNRNKDELDYFFEEAGDAVVAPLDSVQCSEVEVPSVASENITEDNADPIDNETNPVTDPHPVTPTINDEDQFPKPRSCEPRKWKCVNVKKQKEAGEAHISLKGRNVEAVTMGDSCDSKCSRDCHFLFTHGDRLKIFNEFYSLETRTLKWYYITNHVRTDVVKRRTVTAAPGIQTKRNYSNYYFLPVNGIDKAVCQKFFIHTLGISEKCCRTALAKKKASNGKISKDGRGKTKKRARVCTIIREDVMKHIKQYRTVEGHYTRKSSKARYLPEHLNCRMMHSQYRIEREAQGVTENIATLRQYRDVFKKEFNLKFFRPKTDQCAKCLSWKNKTAVEKTDEAARKHEKHMSDKRVGQDLKTEDIDFVKKTPTVESICVATCDLEKVFLCPQGENSEFYYKSKLSLFNFTIFVSGEQKGICYVWDQTEARRGSAEISSCLWLFLKMKAKQGITEFRFYSDNCSAQNKNKFLFSMYIMASIRLNVKIVHRYLETGHPHMEVDSVHAAIQNSIKKKEIFAPSEWYAAIKIAKKTLPRYEVIEMKQDQIFNFAKLAAHQTWDKVKTSEFKEVIFSSAEPGTIYYKTEYKEEAKKTCVIKKKPGHPVNWKSITLPKMYKAKIPLRPIERRDLRSMCESGAIPSRYHNYYNTLINSNEETVQPPLPQVQDEDGSASSSGENSDNDSTDGE